MPDIGWMELLVIGVVALIVVGPKDLPMMFRRLGQFTGRIRAMARDFQRAMDEAADETGMTEINRDLRNAARYTRNPVKAGKDALKDAVGDLDPTKFPEGSHTRKVAEERKAKADAVRQTAEAKRQSRAAGPDGGQEGGGSAAMPEPAGSPAPAADADAAPAPPRTGTGAS